MRTNCTLPGVRPAASAHDLHGNLHRDREAAGAHRSVRRPRRRVRRVLRRVLVVRAVRRHRELVVEPAAAVGPQVDPHFVVRAVADVVRVLLREQRLALLDVEAHVDVVAVGRDAGRRGLGRRLLMLHVPGQRHAGGVFPGCRVGLRIERRRRRHGRDRERRGRRRRRLGERVSAARRSEGQREQRRANEPFRPSQTRHRAKLLCF